MDWITNGILLQFIAPIITLLGGLLIGRKKGQAETSKAEGSALSIMQETYTQLVSDMKNRYNELQQEIESLKDVNGELNKSIDKLIKEIEVLQDIK